jgi:hypothetical protein
MSKGLTRRPRLGLLGLRLAGLRPWLCLSGLRLWCRWRGGRGGGSGGIWIGIVSKRGVRASTLILAVAALRACHCNNASLGQPVHTLVAIGGTQCTSWLPTAYWSMLKRKILIELLAA